MMSGKSLTDAARALGKKGGPARAKSLTKARRSQIATMGGKARAKRAEGKK